MVAKLVTLDNYLGLMTALDREQFVEVNSGLHLLAMGLISVEEIKATLSAVPLVKVPEEDKTVPFRIPSQARHDLRQPHALAGHAFHLKPDSDQKHLTLGRQPSCEIHVPDDSVSERHCRVEVQERCLLIEDLGSTNGTSINLRRLARGQAEILSDGDLLTVGRYSFQLLDALTLYSQLEPIRAR